MSWNLEALLRPHIKNIIPYSSARDEFKGTADVYLDANENSMGSPLPKWYHRYPDPYQEKIKAQLSQIKGVDASGIFIGNGSDECIDLLFRIFCRPETDNVIICPPTYGMYEVSAAINNVPVKKVPLLSNFQLDIEGIANAADEYSKIIWLCSPNNPTGNCLNWQDVEMVLNNFQGMVVVDEAYINFARQKSWVTALSEYPNLVVLQTLSKAWGLAGLRVGMAFAAAEIIEVLNRVKPPYNVSQPAQELVLKALEEVASVNDVIQEIVAMRNELALVFRKMSIVEQVYDSDANFLLLKVQDANDTYKFLLEQGIVVRNRNNVQLCENCIRITIGTEKENTMLVDALLAYTQLKKTSDNG